MKKYIFLVFVFASTNAFAQGKFTVGFDLGSNIAGQSVSPASDNRSDSYTPSYLLGIEAGYSLTEALSLRAQFFIDERIVSSTEKLDALDVIVLSEKRTAFLEIPLTAKYSLFGNESQGYIFAGPVIAFVLINFKYYHVPSPNFGITGGAGYSHAFSQLLSFFAEAAYTFGLRNISDNTSSKEYSRDFRINTGLLFTID